MTPPPVPSEGPLPVNARARHDGALSRSETGQRVRTRLTPEVRVCHLSYAGLSEFPGLPGSPFPIKGKYWFSRSQGHVSFESRFEMTALP